MAWLDGEAASERRAQIPIVAYIGPNGSGKSLLAVDDCSRALNAGRRVLSTCRLVDPSPDAGECQDPTCTWAMHPHHPPAHPLWGPLITWGDLIVAEHCDVLLDEVSGVASSRDTSGLPAPIADMLQQLRRRDVRLRWTAPAWARADVLLREVTQAAVLCHGWFPRKAAGQLWRVQTVVTGRMIDARDLDEITQAQRLGTSRNRPSTWVHSIQRVSVTPARNLYRTLDSVSSLSASVERGTCVMCGGRRTQPRCTCGEDAAASDAGTRGRARRPSHVHPLHMLEEG